MYYTKFTYFSYHPGNYLVDVTAFVTVQKLPKTALKNCQKNGHLIGSVI